MQYLRNEKILDVTDCDFKDLEHMEKSIGGSIATKIGFANLRLTKEQKAWYKQNTGDDKKFKDKDIIIGKDRRKK